MSEASLKPNPEDAEKVFQGEIFSVWQWQQELYDGSFATFEKIKRNDYASVIGVLPDNRIMLVHDEQPHRDAVLTPAGGVVEDGESPEDGVKREFMEETGYEMGELIEWRSFTLGEKTEWVIYSFIGRGLKKVSEPNLEAGERIEIVTYSFDEFLELGKTPLLRDNTLRIILLEALLDDKKKAQLKTDLYG